MTKRQRAVIDEAARLLAEQVTVIRNANKPGLRRSGRSRDPLPASEIVVELRLLRDMTNDMIEALEKETARVSTEKPS